MKLKIIILLLLFISLYCLISDESSDWEKDNLVGKVKQISIKQFQDGHNYSTEIKKYNENGYIIEQSGTRNLYVDHVSIQGMKYTFEYNDYNDIQKVTVYQVFGASDDYLNTMFYYYDKKNLVKIESTMQADKIQKVFEYDTNNNCIHIEWSYSKNQNMIDELEITDYKYDSDNLLIEKIISKSYAQYKVEQVLEREKIKYVYTYNEDNYISEIKTYDILKSKHNLLNRITYKYNSNHGIDEEYFYNRFDKLSKKKKHIYFDNNRSLYIFECDPKGRVLSKQEAEVIDDKTLIVSIIGILNNIKNKYLLKFDGYGNLYLVDQIKSSTGLKYRKEIYYEYWDTDSKIFEGGI